MTSRSQKSLFFLDSIFHIEAPLYISENSILMAPTTTMFYVTVYVPFLDKTAILHMDPDREWRLKNIVMFKTFRFTRGQKKD